MTHPSSPLISLPFPPELGVTPLDEIPTAELAAAFIEAKVTAGRSPETVGSYRWILDPFAKAYPFLPLDPSCLEGYWSSLTGLGDESVADVALRLGTFYRWLVHRRYIPPQLNPFIFVERPRRSRKLPRFLSEELIRRVMRVSRPPVERALISVLLASGPRIGELHALTKDDVRERALVLASGKTGERIVPLDQDVANYLRELDTHYLFPAGQFGEHRQELTGKPLTVDGMRNMVKRVLKRAGYKGPKLGPHLLRHTFATQYIAQGGSTITLARILGHANTRMTDRYVSLSLVHIQEEYQRVNALESILGMVPLTPNRELVAVQLPEEVRDVPVLLDGRQVKLMLVEDRRKHHVYYYIRARVGSGRDGGKRWSVASLGTDLPLQTVDAYRLSVDLENQVRAAKTDGPGRN